MNKKKVLIILILGIVILGIGIFFWINNKNSNKIEVLDTTYNCINSKEVFYEDDNYTYSFTCIKSSYVYIKFENGDKVLIKEALNNNLVTIDEIEKSGLDFVKEEK